MNYQIPEALFVKFSVDVITTSGFTPGDGSLDPEGTNTPIIDEDKGIFEKLD